MVLALIVCLLAWGAFAFGAVYAWAYQPLIAACVVAGLASFAVNRDAGPRLTGARWLAVALAVFGAAAALQLAPIPLSWLRGLSPQTMEALGTLSVPVANGAVDAHALSIAPSRTVTGIALFAAYAILMFGAARLLSIRGPRALAAAIAVLGVLLAVIGIVQKPLFGHVIYGFWTPQYGRNPFGPFVNKNHFAGWMLMALPVVLGLFCAGVAHATQDVKTALRDRVLWLSSPAANRLILIAGAAALMALSLVLTMSRSGITSMVLALGVTAAIALRRQRTQAQRRVAGAYLVVLFVAVFGWAGVEAVVSRFAEADWSEFNNRRGAWADAVSIASRFPLAGTGLNTYSVATVLYQEHDLARHYLQAHNDYLQLLAEGGALLAAPAIACVVAFVALVRRRFREETSTTGYWLRAGAVTGIAAMALQETVEFSLQMPGNAAMFAVLCGIAIHETRQRAGSPPATRVL